MGKAEREKGKRGEREAAKELTRILGTPVSRTQQFKGTAQSADLEGVNGLHLEVKRVEKFSLYPAMEQAKEESEDSLPLLLHKRNRKKWVAICYLDDLAEIAKIIGDIPA